jgi:integrase
MSDSNRLNAMRVAKITEPGRYGDGGGLYLRVAQYPTKGGLARSKNWIFRFERDGRERQMGLGSYTTLPLAEARVKARECRMALLDGLDPIETRRSRRMAARIAAARDMTFKACAEAFIAERSKGWKNPVHAEQWPASLTRHVYPTIGALPVSSVDTDLILKILTPIWSQIPDTASRVRGRVEKVLDWAKARSFRTGENPARWRGHLDHLLARPPKVLRIKHHAAVAYGDLPDLMRVLRDRPEVSSRALEFLILTAARTTETIGARRSEIDFSEKLWTVPAERMKSARPHIVPLSERAIVILRALPDEGDPAGYIFLGAREGQPLSNMAMLELLRGLRPGFTVHGFRSSFRDWAGDRTNYQREVIEAALAHVVEDETEAAYRRSTAVQKRRRLMTDWAKFCASIPAKGNNVTPIRGKKISEKH